METARDEFMCVAGLDLEGDLGAGRLNDARVAGDRFTQRGGRKVPEFNLQSDGALIRLKKRIERFPRRAFDQANEPRGAEDGRHAIGSEVNNVLRADDEAQLAKSASGRAG